MFIEQYRLERNPFAEGRVSSLFASHSAQLTAAKLARLLRGHLQCLYITGVAGVGKTTIIENQLGKADEIAIGRVNVAADAVTVLKELIKDLGLGDVDGSLTELRRIIEVFLQHQASSGRRSLIVADGVERSSPGVLREVEHVGNLRLRGRPVVQLLLTTRNEDLVASMISRQGGTQFAPTAHQRLLGFTMEETAAYLRTCVEGAGCQWFRELFPEELIVDIQAFTQGVVADVDALCRDALETLARESGNEGPGQPSLNMTMLKNSAGRLHLKYDSSAWKAQHSAVMYPGTVRERTSDKLQIDSAQLVVTSGGQRIAEVTLNRPRMVLGRDTSCDISLDSGYVSRYQNLFMETGEGWMLIDLNSTNGCFVNGRRVHEHRLRDGDLISLGEHQLRFNGAQNTREEPKPVTTATKRLARLGH